MPYAMPGIIKKQTKVYTKGNILPHLGLVVILPRNLAPSRGTLRIRGTGYQTRMPKMLKKRWHSATCHA